MPQRGLCGRCDWLAWLADPRWCVVDKPRSIIVVVAVCMSASAHLGVTPWCSSAGF
jgi:hypothetical protein